MCISILYLGAKPVFIDIDENTLCLTLLIVKKNNQKNKSNHCSLLGNMPNYDEIIKVSKIKLRLLRICRKHWTNLKIKKQVLLEMFLF